jgi:hypothetical protein
MTELFVRRVDWSNDSSSGTGITFTNGDELVVRSGDKKFAGLVLTHGKIVMNVEKRIIAAREISEVNFLPIGECHFFSPCGGIEYLPGVSKNMLMYLLLSSGKELDEIIDHRFQKEKKIDPRVIGL